MGLQSIPSYHIIFYAKITAVGEIAGATLIPIVTVAHIMAAKMLVI